MSYEDQERTERALFSAVFRATTAEYEAILSRVYATPEFLDYDVTNGLLQWGCFHLSDPKAREMVTHSTRVYLRLRAMVAEFAAEVVQ